MDIREQNRRRERDQLEQVCKEHDLIRSITYFKPHNGNKENLATWLSIMGGGAQIEFFLISKNVEIGPTA